ncbi:MAG: aROK [Gammaproteobacteria bacterium]|jgi:shikimate kinase|nr:aROK [Gammaproteobacteria bacterium]
MPPLPKHIVLLGFKHVGKSVIGKNLARKWNNPFIDLDNQIELLYEKKKGAKLTCREIMNNAGQHYFRLLEVNALCQTLDAKPSVISLGGGTVLNSESRRLIKSSILVHITAPRDIVFERILMSGRPAFFTPDEDFLESFNRLWEERKKIFESICDYSIVNNGTVDHTVDEIINKIKIKLG